MSIVAGAILLATLAGTAGSTDPARRMARFAIVIGENVPLDRSRAELRYADDDAIMAARMLREAGVKTTLLVRPDADTRRLFGEGAADTSPTRAALHDALSRAFDAMRAARANGDRVEFYLVYSGHGDVRWGEGYVALEDGRLSRSDLYENVLTPSPADRNHVIIDACRSYFLVFGKGPGGRRRPHALDLGNVRERFPTTGFVLSTSADQDSHEWAKLRSGIFSYEVRSALRGAADANLDASISYRELGAFVETANAGIQNARFRPQAVVLAPRDDAAGSDGELLRWREGLDTLEVRDGADIGHFFLEDREGIRHADAHPAAGQGLRLWVPSRRPLYVRTAAGETERTITTTGAVDLEHLAVVTSDVGAKGSLHVAFEALFEEPFGAANVAVFDLEASVRLLRDPPGPSFLEIAHDYAPAATAGTLVVGLAASVTAAAIRSGSPSQQNVPAANRRIDALNVVAVAGYSVAAASALVWLLLEIGLFEGAEDEAG